VTHYPSRATLDARPLRCDSAGAAAVWRVGTVSRYPLDPRRSYPGQALTVARWLPHDLHDSWLGEGPAAGRHGLDQHLADRARCSA